MPVELAIIYNEMFLKVWPFCLSKTEYIIFKGGERGCKDLEVESLFFLKFIHSNELYKIKL